MNEKQIYVVYDKVAGEVASPLFMCNNDEVAKRQFVDLLDKNPQFKPNSDFQLVNVGKFDLHGARVTSVVDTYCVVFDGCSIIQSEEVNG